MPTIKERVRAMASSGLRRIADHGSSAELRTARAVHYCHIRDQYPAHCSVRIEPGVRYVRSVMFPNHDVYGYVDRSTGRPLRRPVVHDICLNCARNYTDLDVLAALADALNAKGDDHA